MDIQTYLHWLTTGTLAVTIGCIVLLMSLVLKGKLCSYNLNEQLTEKDNPAIGLTTAGYLVGCAIIFIAGSVGLSDQDSGWESIAIQWLYDLAYVLVGIMVLNLSRWLLDRVLIGQLDIKKALVEDQNVALGAVEGASLIASGCIIAGAIHGEGSWITALVFYALGQIAMMIFIVLYRWITKYDLLQELKDANAAAGTAFAMTIVALGIIILKATVDDFESWETNLQTYGWYIIFGLIMFTILRIVVDHLALPKSTLHHEIETDRSLNAAWIEGSMALSASGFIWFML